MPRLIEILWCLVALFLFCLQVFINFKGPAHKEAIFLYLAFGALYFLSLQLLKNSLARDQKMTLTSKNLAVFPIRKRFYLLGVLFLLATTPFFENDHYRYLWEGRILWWGENPYFSGPKDLTHISYSKKEFIAFPELTTIYPPLALLFFSLHAWPDFEFALRLLMMSNAFLVWVLIKKLWELRPDAFSLALCLPLLQKEFIQSVHVDLLALLLCFMGLMGIKTGQRNLILLGLSVYTKIVSILLIPFLVFRTHVFSMKKALKKKDLLFFLLALLPLGLFYVYLDSYRPHSGVAAFNKYWVWNPGFYGLLTQGFLLSHEFSRVFCLGFFLLYSLFFYLWPTKTTEELALAISMVFLGLMFFSPVCNPWYFIWALPFCWVGRNSYGLFYCYFSFLCYLPQVSLAYASYSQIGLHSFFLLALAKFLALKRFPRFRFKRRNHRKECV